MKKIQIQVPDDLDLTDKDYTMIIASKLYEDGKLSAGQAADLVGLKSPQLFGQVLCDS